MRTLTNERKKGILKSHITTVKKIKQLGLFKASGIDKDALLYYLALDG